MSPLNSVFSTEESLENNVSKRMTEVNKIKDNSALLLILLCLKNDIVHGTATPDIKIKIAKAQIPISSPLD